MTINRDTADWGHYQPQRRNILINGKFDVWQRGTTFASVTNEYTVDRWKYTATGTMIVDMLQQSNTGVPKGMNKYLYAGVAAADTSLTASDFTQLEHRIEGLNSAVLGWHLTDQASKSNITLSFWAGHSKTGTYCVAFRNNGNSRSYVAEYTQAVANAWEYHTITVPAPTDGTWLTDNGLGLEVSFTWASGTTFHTTADSWQTGNYIATSNQVNAMDSTANAMRTTGVQLEVGNDATDFEYRSFGEELALCQRYFEKSYNHDVVPGNSSGPGLHYETTETGTSGGAGYNNVSFAVAKRATPATINIYAVDGTIDRITDGTNVTRAIGLGTFVSDKGESGFNQNYTLSGAADGRRVFHWTADSEI
jgi:hypothetical protein